MDGEFRRCTCVESSTDTIAGLNEVDAPVGTGGASGAIDGRCGSPAPLTMPSATTVIHKKE